MPEMIIGSPLDELELPDQDRLDPAALRHLRHREATGTTRTITLEQSSSLGQCADHAAASLGASKWANHSAPETRRNHELLGGMRGVNAAEIGT